MPLPQLLSIIESLGEFRQLLDEVPPPGVRRDVGGLHGSGDAVVLVDPHAAHEKILYTQLQARWSEPASPSSDAQLLLMPVVIECPADRAARVAAEHDFFSRAGFTIDQFGPGAVRCTAACSSVGANCIGYWPLNCGARRGLARNADMPSR